MQTLAKKNYLGIADNDNICISNFKFFLIYCLARIALWILTFYTNASPYICYDDYYTYDKLNSITASEIANWLNFRNIYYLICPVLNRIRFFNYISGPRILNFILFYILCIKLKEIAELLGYDKKNIKLMLIIFALSPYYTVFSMVSLREVICSYCVVYIFWAFFCYLKRGKTNILGILIIAVVLYFTRVYILEVLAFVIGIYMLLHSNFKAKSFFFLAALILLVYILINWDKYLYVLNNKFNGYVVDSTHGTGMLSRLEIHKISDIYKLAILIPFFQISPIPGAIHQSLTENSWSGWISYFSGVAAFFVPYCWIHIYKIIKKMSAELNIVVFYLIFIVVIAVTKPDNSRFGFFLTPFFYLFGCLEFKKMQSKSPANIIIGILFAAIPYMYLLI